jgi:hypothetical protein
METAALVVSGIASILALGAFGVTVWMVTHQPSDTSVTELALELKRSRKAAAMRVVREEAAASREASAPLGKDGRPLPFGPMTAAPAEPVSRKQSLRKRFYGTTLLHRGNGDEPLQ